jgi:Flp pilus assembly protein TadD
VTIWLDRLVLAGIVALLLATPIAFGAVHPWAYGPAIAVVALLLALWAVKVALFGVPHEGHRVAPGTIAVPLALFVVLVAAQLVPLPPALLRAASPGAHEIYATSLPGWPESAPYADLLAAAGDPGRDAAVGWRLLPAADDLADPAVASRLAAVAGAATGPRERLRAGDEVATPSAWRPLSLAARATRIALLKVTAYLALLLVVALYPFNRSPEGDWRPMRVVLLAAVASGAIVAAVALLQRFTWNGHLLWFFVPHDWPGPDPRPQTSGPFVSRNSLAGYLVLVLPLAVAGTLCRTHLDLPGRARASRALLAGAAALVALGIVMSLSRGGWLAALVALSLLAGLLAREPREDRPWPLRSRGRCASVAALVAVALLLLVLAPLDPERANDVDARLEATVSDATSVVSRLDYGRASLAMLRDFPLLGAGLGAWPDLFARYDDGPYSRFAPRQAHNDYLQLAAETGVAGALLVLAAAFGLALCLGRGLARRSSASRPLVAALSAALAGLAVHETVDFDLQIPAIAVLAAVLAGAGLRSMPVPTWRPSPRKRLAACGVALAAALVLVVAALGTASRDGTAAPTTVAEALRLVDARPTRAGTHLALYYLLERELPDAPRTRELEIATRLDPQSPFAHDALAVDLARRGERAAALAAIEQSVFVAPQASGHFYLRARLAPYLSGDEVEAIERGLARAREARREEAAVTLAGLYGMLGRHADEARVWAEVAREREDPDERFAALRAAGIASLAAREPAPAEQRLRDAVALRPSDTSAQSRLIEAMAARGASYEALREATRHAARSGADAYRLHVAIAEAARERGDEPARVAALEDAVQVRPSVAELHLQLGLAYLDAHRYERAARALRRAAELDPAMPNVWYYVGRAEAARYDLVAAERALERAAELAPEHDKTRAELAQVRTELAGVRP